MGLFEVLFFIWLSGIFILGPIWTASVVEERPLPSTVFILVFMVLLWPIPWLDQVYTLWVSQNEVK